MSNSNRKLALALLLGTIVAIVIEFYTLKLWLVEFSVPFNYWGDTLWFIVPIKGMLENGWTYYNAQLSAPFGLSVAGFPSMTNLDWLVMKVISIYIDEAGSILNIFWLLNIILTTWSSITVLHFLGVGNLLGVGASVVYAFLPYALLRNVAHISLVYYIVPFLLLLAISFAKGCVHPFGKKIKILGYAAIIAQGFSYIYFSFFSVLIFQFAGLVGYVNTKSWQPVKAASVACVTIIMVSTLNLTPSFISWVENGKPADMEYKSAAEAEVYGLKIRKMLAPNIANEFPILKQWGRNDKAANFPNENENVTARLGPLASVGFLILLLTSLGLIKQREIPDSSIIKSIASLNLFILLFATVGGLGAIFNLLIPDIRAYNRFSVFIAFVAIAGIAILWQNMINLTKEWSKKIIFYSIFVMLAVFSLYDQILDAQYLVNRRPIDEIQARSERKLVKIIENEVPEDTAVFQLPFTGFPPDGGLNHMLPYDHARPYLWSTKLHWSWPSFSPRHRAWVSEMSGLEGVKLAEALVLSKFGLVWVDRFGYKDNGVKIINSLLEIGCKELANGISDRYVILDLDNISQQMKLRLGASVFHQQQEIILNAPLVEWNDGFYGQEQNQFGKVFRWSRASSGLKIRNLSNAPWVGFLSLVAASGKPGELVISSDGNIKSMTITSSGKTINFPLKIDQGRELVVKFKGTMGPIELPPNETRDLHYYLMDLKLIANIDAKISTEIQDEVKR